MDLKEAYDIIERSKVIIFKWTLKLDIPTAFVSENISQFGYEPEDFYTGKFKDYWEFIHEDDRERVMNDLYYARKNKDDSTEFVHENEYRIVTKDGEVRWVCESVIHELEEDIMYERGLLRDITEKKTSQIKLKESEARYKNIFDNTLSVIFTFDSNDNIITKNNAFDNLFASVGIFNVKNFNRILDSNQYTKGSFFEHCKENSGIEMQMNFKEDLGEEVVVEFKPVLINSASGEIDKEILVVGNNITERIRAERRIKYISNHDSLTGVYNRRYLEEFIRNNSPEGFTAITGDIYCLKIINDGFGHDAGDYAIKTVAKVLATEFSNKKDVVARLSGDEFCVLTKSKKYKEKIFNIVDKLDKIEEYPFKIGIAMGYESYSEQNDSFYKLIKKSDSHMYRFKIKKSTENKRIMVDSIIDSLRKDVGIYYRDTQNISDEAVKIARKMRLDDRLIDELILAVKYSKLGIACIDRNIILKKGELNASELKELRLHTESAYRILVLNPELSSIAEAVLHIHEAYDGSGYPAKIKGRKIPIISRIIAVVDSYDAMINETPYRKAKTLKEAQEELKEMSNKRYDPYIVELYLDLLGGQKNE